MLLSEGATATSPMDTVASRSNWWVKVMPLFSVLSRPPDALATQKVLGSVSQTARATMRPLMFAGPMQRQRSALTHASGRLVSLEVATTVGSALFPADLGSLFFWSRPPALGVALFGCWLSPS